jgi:hypothetical protein
MRKLSILLFFFLASPVWATVVAKTAGNWSTSANWVGGSIPVGNDAVDLNGLVMVMDIVGIPASGTLTSITSTYQGAGSILTVGQLTLAMTGTNHYDFNCTTINCGAANGMIKTSGSAAGSSLTINCTDINGPNTANVAGLYDTSTGTTTINATGTITGGSANGAHCLILGSATGVFNVNSKVRGSVSNITAAGVYFTGGTANLNGIMDNTGVAVAWYGRPPTTWTQSGGVSNAQYAQWISSGTNTIKLGPEPTAVQLLLGVQCGDVLGSLVCSSGGGVFPITRSPIAQ